jgi:gamma-glutamyltranspeptidase/glutathione hydrolase
MNEAAVIANRRNATAVHAGVVCAQPLAAEAGLRVLRAGGNAADAAVAVAAALAVVDPANCGVGGYGGFAVVSTLDRRPRQVRFNAATPASMRSGDPPGRGAGARVTPPAVVPGLCALSQAFGRVGLGAAVAPAIDLAARGFAITPGLARALRWAHDQHRGLNDAFRRTFMPTGEPLAEGRTLAQPTLASTLSSIAECGAEALGGGTLVAGLLRTVNDAGGNLTAGDFARVDADLTDAAHASYADADVFASDPGQCGASVLLSSLNMLDGVNLGENRGERYVDLVGNALIDAWRARDAMFAPLSRATSQTTHLCTADADGMLVSMTFTHGPLWFGSGLLDEASGIVLNCGIHILARRNADAEIVAQPHLAPAIVRRGQRYYAVGSPGGRRIPAIVLQAIVDLVHYETPVERVLDAPRLSGNGDGTLDGEAGLIDSVPGRRLRLVETNEYFGPAAALGWSADGVRCAVDPRFEDSAARTT